MKIAATEIIPAPITCAHCASPAIVLHQEQDTRKHPTPLCAEHLPKLTQRLKDWLRMQMTISVKNNMKTETLIQAAQAAQLLCSSVQQAHKAHVTPLDFAAEMVLYDLMTDAHKIRQRLERLAGGKK